MADNVFQPQVAQVNSAVTPQEGVADTSAVDLFADVAAKATEATFSYTGQQEIGELKTKFERITQARAAGGNASALQLKARAALDTARANSPWVAGQAEKLYRETFSGGSSTGVFEATPEEKAKEKHLQTLEETRLTLGLSSTEEAQKRLTMDANAKSAKIQADAQKEARTYNGDLVTVNTQTQLVNSSVKFMDAVNRAMTNGGGSLDSEAIRSFNLTIDQEVARLKQELNSQVRDPKSGHILIDKGSYEGGINEIESWAKDTKASVEDQSYLKTMTTLNAEQSAEINFIATNKYKTLKVLGAAGGQAAVQAYITAAQRPEGAARQLLIGANPIAKDMFDQQGSFTTAGLSGLDKVTVPTPQALPLTQAEAYATGTMLNDPANSELALTTADNITESPESAASYEGMVAKNPDSAAMMWSTRMKAWMNANPTKATTALDTTLSGLKKNFDVASAMNGKFATTFTVTPRHGVSTLSGDGITPEHAPAVRGVVKLFEENPEYLKKYGAANGNPDMTPMEATQAYLGGATTVPEGQSKPTSPNNNRAVRDKQIEGFKSLSERVDKKALDDFKKALSGKDRAELFGEEPKVEEPLPREATAPEASLRLQPFIDKGVTKEEMLATLESLGFNKNMLNDEMKAVIEEAYGEA